MLQPQRVLVTGGTGLLGSALTRELCAHGLSVCAVFRANEERAVRLQSETGCAIVCADCSCEDEVEALFQNHRFDAVVHLAGWNRDALALSVSPALWNEIVRSHLLSSFLLARAALRDLPRGGQLLLVSSRVGLRGGAGQSAYAAAKAGVFGLMKSAALEGHERGVRVNALCPGYAPQEGAVLSAREENRRRGEDCLPDSDASWSFATFVRFLLCSHWKGSGQILRPDCRI